MAPLLLQTAGTNERFFCLRWDAIFIVKPECINLQKIRYSVEMLVGRNPYARLRYELSAFPLLSTTQGSCVFYEQQHGGKSPEPSAAVGLIIDQLISCNCEVLTPAPCMEWHFSILQKDGNNEHKVIDVLMLKCCFFFLGGLKSLYFTWRAHREIRPDN